MDYLQSLLLRNHWEQVNQDTPLGQEINTGIAKFNAAEQSVRPRVVNPLKTLVNGETIAVGTVIPARNDNLPRPSTLQLESGDHVLLYYVADSIKESDTFFRHGIYVLDTTKSLIPIPTCGSTFGLCP